MGTSRVLVPESNVIPGNPRPSAPVRLTTETARFRLLEPKAPALVFWIPIPTPDPRRSPVRVRLAPSQAWLYLTVDDTTLHHCQMRLDHRPHRRRSGIRSRDRASSGTRGSSGVPRTCALAMRSSGNVTDHATLFIEPNAGQAGAGRITFAVAGLDALLERLVGQRIEHEVIETYSNGVRHVKITDPDGNGARVCRAAATRQVTRVAAVIDSYDRSDITGGRVAIGHQRSVRTARRLRGPIAS